MKRPTRCVLVVSIVALAGLACSKKKKAGSCSSSDECPAGQVCGEDGVCVDADAGPLDAGPDTSLPDAEVCPEARTCGEACCLEDESCLAERCVLANACDDDSDCSDDTYCDEDTCVPWGTGSRGGKDDACNVLVPIGIFAPTEQCSWTGPPDGDSHPDHKNVLGTPVVMDFDFDDDPAQAQPSIVFITYDRPDGTGESAACEAGAFGVVRVIDAGEGCRQLHTIDAVKVRPATSLAAADLDGDGRAEIVAIRCGGGLVAFHYSAGAKRFEVLWEAALSDRLAPGRPDWSGPSIHDLDDDGRPEIIHWDTVWSADGKLIDRSLFDQMPYHEGMMPAVADLEGDGKVDMTDGNKAWEWDVGAKSWKEKASAASGQLRGQVALADFGTFAGASPDADDRATLDGIAEIAVVSDSDEEDGTLRVQTIEGRVVFGPIPLPPGAAGNSGIGGPPTVADFDGDGRVEVAAAGFDSYTVFDPDCQATPAELFCPTKRADGILWSQPSQDHTSSATGSSLFDFDGDGVAEVIYADECFTRVYEGTSGQVLYSQWRSSCTWHENPIVADVDGDFNAELVVPANANCAGDYKGEYQGNPDLDCRAADPADKHPTTGEALDPLFAGLRCKEGAECLGGECKAGLCRCVDDEACGGGGFVCVPPRNDDGEGNVCRAAYKGRMQGVRVYKDSLDRWVASRTIWNQHAYAVTHINEDGTVPRTSEWKANWRQDGLNNFRQNVQGSRDPDAGPDLTSQRTAQLICDDDQNAELAVRLCNRGAQPVGKGVPTTFYLAAPADKKAICTARSTKQVDPGQCERVSCVWNDAPTQPVDVHVVADDDGSGNGENSECREQNNTAVLRGVHCVEPLF